MSKTNMTHVVMWNTGVEVIPGGVCRSGPDQKDDARKAASAPDDAMVVIFQSQKEADAFARERKRARGLPTE